MLHWLQTAWNTYVLHVEHGNGYQWWSGFGGRTFGSATLIALGAGMWHRHNCHQPGCWRAVRHGKTFCPKHEPVSQSSQTDG